MPKEAIPRRKCRGCKALTVNLSQICGMCLDNNYWKLKAVKNAPAKEYHRPGGKNGEGNTHGSGVEGAAGPE